MTEQLLELTEVPDYYSDHYHYRRYPAKIEIRMRDGRSYFRSGSFDVWSREVERPNPDHVTWNPDPAVLVSERYRNAAWHAERAEKAARPEIEVGQRVKLGGLIVEVPRRANQNVSHVPCKVIEEGGADDDS